jgi:hypothetical protein
MMKIVSINMQASSIFLFFNLSAFFAFNRLWVANLGGTKSGQNSIHSLTFALAPKERFIEEIKQSLE